MLVIDASVAVKFVIEEPGSSAAYAIVIGPEPLIAPDWILAECANALGKKVLVGVLPRPDAEASFTELPRFFARLFATDALLESALHWSLELGHAFYDCLYLALALDQSSKVITADREFANAAKRAGLGESVELLRW